MSKLAAIAFAPDTARPICRCSFCRLPESKVEVLVQSEGTQAAICDGCLRIASSAVSDWRAKRGGTNG